MGVATRRCALLLALVVLVAAARTAAVGDGGGNGGGGGEATEDQVLRLWSASSARDGAAEDDDGRSFNWEWEDDDDDDEHMEDDHVMAVQGKGACRNVVNVESFGAVGDGDGDDTEAFASAWKKACSLDNTVFLVPAGRRYKVGAIQFVGPCKDNRIIIQIQGTIVAPEEPSEWDPRSPRLWLLFSGLAGARIQGGGVIDGSGSNWWANSCKINNSNPCRPAPTAVTIDSCRGVRVKNLRVQNAQQMHVTVSRSRGVRVSGLRIAAPEDSPNTDGIHVADSTAVTIQRCRIGTGDDCVSIVNGSFSVKMRDIDCGPGHGISIGSLGKGGAFAAVADVSLDRARISRAQNGVRIKTWQGGAGYVRGVRFADVVMDAVDHPIVIDQFYCDVPRGGGGSGGACANQTSAVVVSDVSYRNISGTSRRAEAIRFACSDAVPCTGIVLSDINLRRVDDDGDVQTVCNCAVGFDYGRVQPAADCLRSSTCGGAPDKNHDDDEDEQGKDEEAVMHTEL